MTDKKNSIQVQSSELVIRVNAGGERYQDNRGRVWEREQAYYPGSWGTFDLATTDVLSTNDQIAGADDPTLFQTLRVGERIRYQFDVPNGLYQVKLLFAEIYWESAEAERQDVFLQGQKALTNFSIFEEVGHDTAVEKLVKTKVTKERLEVSFIGRSLPMHSGAKICALEISRASRPRKG